MSEDTAEVYRIIDANLNRLREGLRAVEEQARFLWDHQDLTETGQESQSTSGRRLNPWFVEWLMSFPAGWTVCEPSETLSAQRKQLWHCGISSGGSVDS